MYGLDPFHLEVRGSGVLSFGRHAKLFQTEVFAGMKIPLSMDNERGPVVLDGHL